MFNFVRQPSRGAGLAIGYVTGGSLAMIWAGIWWYYMSHNEPADVSNWKWYVCTGLFFSGLAVFLIGLFVGRLGREAKQADANMAVQNTAGTTPVAAAPQVGMPQVGVPQMMVPAGTVPQAPMAGAVPVAPNTTTTR